MGSVFGFYDQNVDEISMFCVFSVTKCVAELSIRNSIVVLKSRNFSKSCHYEILLMKIFLKFYEFLKFNKFQKFVSSNSEGCLRIVRFFWQKIASL